MLENTKIFIEIIESKYLSDKHSTKELIYLLDKNWHALHSVYKLEALNYLIEVRKENGSRIIEFLNQLLVDDIPYYRRRAMERLVELYGQEQREMLEDVISRETDNDNRAYAITLLADIFRNQRDKRILKIAHHLYTDQQGSLNLKLCSCAAMMFQLGISQDEDGRPAWWDEEEEELQHPLILRAIRETQEILSEEDSGEVNNKK